MDRLPARPAAALLALALAALPAGAHDDDPKILDRTAPYAGQGFRPGALLRAGGGGPQAAAQASQLGGALMLSALDDLHVEFPRSGVQLLSWLPLDELAPEVFTGNDCWGYTSPSGREYAIIGHSHGTTFVEITDPSDPVVIHYQAGEQSLWRDVKVYQQYAYIVSEGGGGIQVMNLGNIDGGVVTLANQIFSGGTSESHNVAIDTDSGYLYRCGGGNNIGLRVYRLSNNPANPQYVGSWNSRYVHDVQVVTYTSGPYAGREIAFACSGFGNGASNTGLTILDVTNKNNIFTRAQFYYSNAAYSHQAWLSEDRTKLFLDDELDEDGTLPTTTHVIDVTNLNSPSYLGNFTNGSSAIGHNLYTKGDLCYQANYRSGLRIFDVSSAPGATEVAYFDTWPGDDDDAFNGLWSCYPYFPSGVVIGSDLERGLFVWWVGEPKLTFDVVGGVPEVLDPAGEAVTVQISELSAGDLQPGSATLHLDTGGGVVEVPLTAQGGGAFQAQFPATACGTEVRWFVSARSTDGLLWTYPAEAPYNHLDSVAAEGRVIAFEDDMEQDLGWTVGDPSDSATAGVWRRDDPVETAASPEDDRSPNGTLCWTTGLFADIDGGFTTLTSPAFDLQAWHDPVVTFWLYFHRDGLSQGTDQCRVEVSNDDGATWVEMERIQQVPLEKIASWDRKSYHLAQWVTPTAQTRIRVRAQDENLDSFVKALVDDVTVWQAACDCAPTSYCTSAANSAGTAAQIGWSGSTELGQNDFHLTVSGALPGGLGLFFYGPNQVQLPLAEGTLCVGGGALGIQRLQPPLQADASGVATRQLDFTAPPAAAGPGAIGAGSTWNFQFWYRDPQGGPGGSNLSDGLSVTFCQ
jgi:choice-of-anchor B domain-containing protein